jgi:hypothetical protein
LQPQAAPQPEPLLLLGLFVLELFNRRIGDGGKGWIGTDFNKFWFKYDGFVTNGVASDGDLEFLYDKPIPRPRYFDWRVRVSISISRRVWLALKAFRDSLHTSSILHQHFRFAMEDISPKGSNATMICTSPNG